MGEITLHAIAAESGVTVQTVLRHMGSRDGCFARAGERVAARVEAQRGGSRPGDVAGAIDDLVSHYEAEGRLVLNLLSQESAGDPLAVEAAARGRAWHRSWVERCFGPSLSEPGPEAMDALVGATDLYVWKLLRLDLGRSVETTKGVLARLVRGILETS